MASDQSRGSATPAKNVKGFGVCHHRPQLVQVVAHRIRFELGEESAVARPDGTHDGSLILVRLVCRLSIPTETRHAKVWIGTGPQHQSYRAISPLTDRLTKRKCEAPLYARIIVMPPGPAVGRTVR
jgi:hypothetical protein